MTLKDTQTRKFREKKNQNKKIYEERRRKRNKNQGTIRSHYLKCLQLQATSHWFTYVILCTYVLVCYQAYYRKHEVSIKHL